MANPLSTKQIAAMDTIATYTTKTDKEISMNINSLMGSIEATNIVSTRAVLATLQNRGFLSIQGDLKQESVTIILTTEGASFLNSKQSFNESSIAIDKIIAGEVIEEQVVEEEQIVEETIEPEIEEEPILEPEIEEEPIVKKAALKVKPAKEVKVKEVKVRVEHKDENGNFCPKRGDDEKGGKSWNIYRFLRQPDKEGNAPTNKMIENRMKELGGFHTVYYSEIERVRQNYDIILDPVSE